MAMVKGSGDNSIAYGRIGAAYGITGTQSLRE